MDFTDYVTALQHADSEKYRFVRYMNECADDAHDEMHAVTSLTN